MNHQIGARTMGALFAVCLLAACIGVHTQTIRCRVVVYGSEPHTYVGILSEGDGKLYAVYPPAQEEELRTLQGQRLEMTLRFLEKPQGYGSLFLKDGTVHPLSWNILGDSKN
ncbi:MAG: hypothetical protein LBG24_05945 [Treponema sp.]|jgi:hypothetical protein|nr:hypothetical protein [Treponema sp.]